jgi:hypothetical protein
MESWVRKFVFNLLYELSLIKGVFYYIYVYIPSNAFHFVTFNMLIVMSNTFYNTVCSKVIRHLMVSYTGCPRRKCQYSGRS